MDFDKKVKNVFSNYGNRPEVVAFCQNHISVSILAVSLHVQCTTDFNQLTETKSKTGKLKTVTKLKLNNDIQLTNLMIGNDLGHETLLIFNQIKSNHLSAHNIQIT